MQEVKLDSDLPFSKHLSWLGAALPLPLESLALQARGRWAATDMIPVTALQQLTQLTQLALSTTADRRQHLLSLAALSTLQTLHIRVDDGYRGMSDAAYGWSGLPCLHRLELANMRQMGCWDDIMKGLGQATSLTSLSLENVSPGYPRYCEYNVCSYISKLKQLQSLVLALDDWQKSTPIMSMVMQHTCQHLLP